MAPVINVSGNCLVGRSCKELENGKLNSFEGGGGEEGEGGEGGGRRGEGGGREMIMYLFIMLYQS